MTSSERIHTKTEYTPARAAKNEFYTLPRYINSARRVMGSIDLDAASCAEANQTVKAERFYTKDQDGLKLPWYGRTWCNPPFAQIAPGQSTIKPWVQKMIRCYEDKEIEQGILLIPNDTSTKWFLPLWAYPICFPPKRISFMIPGKTTLDQPPFGCCFIYFGLNRDKFIEEFSFYGPISSRWETKRLENLRLW
jgi:DNA N-6-adenine-methyltransferase (Dam)